MARDSQLGMNEYLGGVEGIYLEITMSLLEIWFNSTNWWQTDLLTYWLTDIATTEVAIATEKTVQFLIENKNFLFEDYLPDTIFIISIYAFLNWPNTHQCPKISSRNYVTETFILVNIFKISHNILQSFVIWIVDINTSITSTCGYINYCQLLCQCYKFIQVK